MRKAPKFVPLLTFCVAAFLNLPAAGQLHDFWTSGTSMPTAVMEPATGALLGQLYVVGGFNGSGPIATTQIYNPNTNSWTTGVPLPTPLSGGSGAVVKGILYVIGGSTDGSQTQTSSVWAFNPSTQTWSGKASMPTARQGFGIAIENNIIYVIGGLANGSQLNVVESYDPVANTWTPKTPLFTAKSETAVGVVGNKTVGFTIVAADGYDGTNFIGDNEGYKASTNSWNFLANDPTPRSSPCKGAKGMKMYVAGGANNFGNALNVMEAYNFSTNQWTKKALVPHATEGPGSVIFQGLLYCFGGRSAFQGAMLNNLQIYHP